MARDAFEMTDAELLDLQAELDELERTDPAVRAAADSYDAMAREILGRPREVAPGIFRLMAKRSPLTGKFRRRG